MTKKHLFSAAMVTLSCASLVGGIAWRNRADVGEAGIVVSRDGRLDGLVASTGQTREVPETSYYANLVKLLKENYVESVKDETKLALGSVKEMVGSLGDVSSLYYDEEEFRAYRGALRGQYEGIGALLVLEVPGGRVAGPGMETSASQDPTKIPVARVAAVVPGGPADLAGVKAGDWLEGVDGHTVFSPKLFKEFMEARALARREDVPSEKKFEVSDRLQAVAENMIMPLRAIRKVALGQEGTVRVKFARGDSSFEKTLQRAKSTLPAWSVKDGVSVLRFQPGVSSQLEEHLKSSREITLDLRNSGLGSMEEMEACLRLVASNGKYGGFTNERDKGFVPLEIKAGNASPPKLTLLVDGTTRGPAEVFATALGKQPHVKVVGGKMAGVLERTEVVSLPQGHGYTLVTGVYRGVSK